MDTVRHIQAHAMEELLSTLAQVAQTDDTALQVLEERLEILNTLLTLCEILVRENIPYHDGRIWHWMGVVINGRSGLGTQIVEYLKEHDFGYPGAYTTLF